MQIFFVSILNPGSPKGNSEGPVHGCRKSVNGVQHCILFSDKSIACFISGSLIDLDLGMILGILGLETIISDLLLGVGLPLGAPYSALLMSGPTDTSNCSGIVSLSSGLMILAQPPLIFLLADFLIRTEFGIIILLHVLGRQGSLSPLSLPG